MTRTFAAALALCLAAAPAVARSGCAPRAVIAKQLTERYDGAPVAAGLQSNGSILQVYASEANGTWTVISTTPKGMSCVVTAGEYWRQLPPKPAKPKGKPA